MIVTASARRMSAPTAPVPPDPVVLIISSAYANLPTPGNRVGTGDVSDMPTIQANTGVPAFVTEDGAHHFRLVGLNIVGPSGGISDAIVAIGGQETTLGEFPTDITVDRCLVHGNATNGARRGVQLDCIRGAVVDSYIYDCKEDGFDSQAVWAYNTPGPLKVVNNYLEAAGENVMFGGAAPVYTNSVPSDIEFRLNYLYKPNDGTYISSWQCKNLLELKNARRVYISGNVMVNSYEDAQSGYGVLITPRNEDGSATWSVVENVIIRQNKILDVERGFQLSGEDDNETSQRANSVLIEQNLLEIGRLSTGDRWGHVITNGPQYFTIRHNTWVGVDGVDVGAIGFHESTPDGDNIIWRDNIFTNGSIGFGGTATGDGLDTLNTYFTNYTFTYNLLIGGDSGNYTGLTGNQFPASFTAVFTNFATGDYTVKAAYQGDASDATDPGVDIAALATATEHCVDGQWGSEHSTLALTGSLDVADYPTTWIDTTYADQTGTVHNCSTSAQFTTALANCAVGDKIVLTAGNTFQHASSSFTLRNI